LQGILANRQLGSTSQNGRTRRQLATVIPERGFLIWHFPSPRGWVWCGLLPPLDSYKNSCQQGRISSLRYLDSAVTSTFSAKNQGSTKISFPASCLPTCLPTYIQILCFRRPLTPGPHTPHVSASLSCILPIVPDVVLLLPLLWMWMFRR